MTDVRPKTKHLSAEEILSAEIFEALSGPAKRLYEQVWHRMRARNAGMIVVTDAEIIARTHIIPRELPNAKQELIFHRLLKIEPRHGVVVYQFAAEGAVAE